MKSTILYRSWFGVFATALTAIHSGQQFADEVPSHIVAKVDGEAITSLDVDREIAIAIPNRPVDPDGQQALRKQTAEQLVRRQLVLRYLRDTAQSASQTDVDLAIDRLKKQLAQRESSLEGYLHSRKLDESSMRRSLTWQIGWQRLLDKYLGEPNLQRFFDKHRREFDGTELRVAHILIPVDKTADKTADSAAQAAARKKAGEVLAQLRSGSLSFAEAAKRYSSSPSKESGGDIGWISRHEPMPEPFSRAAFALEQNQISEPVETVFGLHLICCLEVKPGPKKWSDVRPELEAAVTERLFNWAADQTRSKAKIEWQP